MVAIPPELNNSPDLINFIIKNSTWSEAFDLQSGTFEKFNYNPLLAGLNTYISARNRYLIQMGLATNKVSINDAEFLRSIAAISVKFYLLKEYFEDPTKARDLFSQFCQLSGLSVDYLLPKYLTLNTSDSQLVKFRTECLETILCEMAYGPIEMVSEVCHSSEWRATAIDVRVSNLYEWGLVEFFTEQIVDVETWQNFDFKSLPTKDRHKFIRYFYESLNAYTFYSDVLTDWFGAIKNLDKKFMLDDEKNILTFSDSNDSLKISPLEVKIIKAIMAKGKTFEELQSIVASKTDSLKRTKSELNKKTKNLFGASIIVSATEAGDRTVENVLTFPVTILPKK